jgi:hypothetical protein
MTYNNLSEVNARSFTPSSSSAEVWVAPTRKEEFMPDAELTMLAKHSRARARQVLARAKSFRDADAKRKMRRVAVSYKKLARRLEHEAGGPDEA